MEVLFLAQEQLNTLVQYAVGLAPNECCGLLIGRGSCLSQIIPITNVADDPEKRFLMDQYELARLLPQIYTDGYDLLGFYHSHPQGYPIPSVTDVSEANYAGVIQMIVGLNNTDPEVAAWMIGHNEVIPVTLSLDSNFPLEYPHPISNKNTFVMVLSVVIVSLILIMVAINLLPPAPPIP